MANARHLFERVLDGIKSSLSARLILVGGAAADADPTDMHLALSHNRQSTSESDVVAFVSRRECLLVRVN